MAIENFNVPISIETVVILLLIGAAIKHLDMFESIDNKFIPPILFAFGVIFTVITQWPVNVANLVHVVIVALASSLLAVGIHSSGKNMFANGRFVELFLQSYSGDNTVSVPLGTETEVEDSGNDEEPVVETTEANEDTVVVTEETKENNE